MGVSRRKTFEVRLVEDVGRIQVERYRHSRVTASWFSSPMAMEVIQKFCIEFLSYRALYGLGLILFTAR